jgi:hypothetical protein
MMNAATPNAMARSRSHAVISLVARGESDPGARGTGAATGGLVLVGSVTKSILYGLASHRVYAVRQCGNHR